MRFPASVSLSDSSLLTNTFLLLAAVFLAAVFLAAGAGAELSESLDAASFVAVLFLVVDLDSESRIDCCLTSTGFNKQHVHDVSLLTSHCYLIGQETKKTAIFLGRAAIRTHV